MTAPEIIQQTHFRTIKDVLDKYNIPYKIEYNNEGLIKEIWIAPGTMVKLEAGAELFKIQAKYN